MLYGLDQRGCASIVRSSDTLVLFINFIYYVGRVRSLPSHDENNNEEKNGKNVDKHSQRRGTRDFVFSEYLTQVLGYN